jgi:transcriptional regulator with XRE-family HTH domain
MIGHVPVTGRMLRALRESAELSVREVARRARGTVTISHTHLCRVEQGARAATHAVVAAYERATGIRLDADVLAELAARSRPGSAGRSEFDITTAVAMVVAGGLAVEHERRLLHQAAAFTGTPARVGDADVAQVEQLARQLRLLDLRYGGQLAGQLGARTLRWAAGLREATMSDRVRRRLEVAVGTLARQTAWSAFDTDRHEIARGLSRVALGAAVRADDPDLRGHALADVAAQQADLGHAADALQTLRLVDDQRCSPAVRCVLHGVRARSYAALGQRDRCLREIGEAEQTSAEVEAEAAPQWLAGWEPAHTEAVCGHAYALLAETDDAAAEDVVEAHRRLAAAADELTVAGRRRAAALCLTGLARLHQRCGHPDEAAWWAERAQPIAGQLRSARLDHQLAAAKAGANPKLSGPVVAPRAGQKVRSL